MVCIIRYILFKYVISLYISCRNYIVTNVLLNAYHMITFYAELLLKSMRNVHNNCDLLEESTIGFFEEDHYILYALYFS